jgi:Regulator of chromosome condensation (RCC1) repeat
VQVTPATWMPTAIGDTIRFRAVAKGASGVTILNSDFIDVTWNASPPGVVVVHEDGSAFSNRPGSAQVRATVNGVTGTAEVSVVQTIESVVISVALFGRLSALGDSIQLPVAALDRNGFSVGGTTFSFQSLNESTATVSPNGWVKALSPGVANIVASAAGKADTAPVQVLQDVATIALSPDTAVLEDGTTRQFIATLKDRNGYPITGRAPESWSSSDTLVVGVSMSGLATARAVKLGPAKVIATSGGVRGEAPAYVFAPFKVVTTGGAKTCAVSERGRSYCWGWIGPSTGERSLVPITRTATPALDSSIGVGVYVACGLTTDGTVYCWGEAPFGTAGTGISSAPTFSSLAVGYGDAYGLTASGDVYTWSTDVPYLTNVPAATLVPGGLSFTAISATAYACGTVSGGAAYCWGGNGTGGLGDSTYTDRPDPTPVAGGHTFTSVSAGGGHTCGITTSGPTYCWGRNNYGAFGDGTITNSPVPVPGASGLTLTSISAGDWHTCGLVASGAAYCWGLGERGSIGNGSFDPAQLTPAPVSGGLTFASISTGTQHTCGLTSSGALFCWGRNEDGELGDGTGTNRAVPTRVAGSRP